MKHLKIDFGYPNQEVREMFILFTLYKMLGKEKLEEIMKDFNKKHNSEIKLLIEEI